jgi:hypothetical protein
MLICKKNLDNVISYDKLKYNYFNETELKIYTELIKLKKKFINDFYNDIINKIFDMANCEYSNKLTIDKDVEHNKIIDFIENEIFNMTETNCRYGLIKNLEEQPILDQIKYLYAHRLSYTGDDPLDYIFKPYYNEYVFIDLYEKNGNSKIKILKLSNDVHIGLYKVALAQVSYVIDTNTHTIVTNKNKKIKYIPVLNNNILDQKKLYKIIHDYKNSNKKIININKFCMPSEFIYTNICIISKMIYVYSKYNNNEWFNLDFINNDFDMIINYNDLSNDIDLNIQINNMYSDVGSDITIKNEFPKLYKNYKTTNIDFNLLQKQEEEKEEELTNKLNINLLSNYLDLNFGHRSGWSYVMGLIQNCFAYNNNKNIENIKTIHMIDIIEKPFSWEFISTQNTIQYKDVYYNDKIHRVLLKDIKIKYINGTGFHIVKLNNIFIRWASTKWIHDIDETDLLYNNRKSITDDTILKEDWIGVWHNPHNMPEWFDYQHSPQSILKRKGFQESLKKCQGIFVLSKYFADWLSSILPNIKINILYHPTELTNNNFNYDKFIKNEEKCIIQIGYWLRRMCSIGCIKIKNNMYRKIWLYGNVWANTCLENENIQHKNKCECCSDMQDVLKIRLSNELYDEFLSQNICFIHIYDSSANNAVIECIARSTPLIVNKHPAIVEYLGDNYPLYFNDLKDVDSIIENFELIKKGHEYLRDTLEIRNKISHKRFIHDFLNSEIILNLSNNKM